MAKGDVIFLDPAKTHGRQRGDVITYQSDGVVDEINIKSAKIYAYDPTDDDRQVALLSGMFDVSANKKPLFLKINDDIVATDIATRNMITQAMSWSAQVKMAVGAAVNTVSSGASRVIGGSRTCCGG